jgi:probable rRNA maturation factor
VTTGEPAAGEAVVEVRWAEDGAMASGGDAALAGRLERFGRRALLHLDYRVEVSVLLCGSATIRALNERYRGIAAPTDVLSFAQMEAEWPTAVPGQSAGDVVIATDVAARQAAARGESPERELYRLLLHGMLHLMGMDHADPPREHEPMLTLQEQTLHDLLGETAPLGEPVSTTGG